MLLTPLLIPLHNAGNPTYPPSNEYVNTLASFTVHNTQYTAIHILRVTVALHRIAKQPIKITKVKCYHGSIGRSEFSKRVSQRDAKTEVLTRSVAVEKLFMILYCSKILNINPSF